MKPEAQERLIKALIKRRTMVELDPQVKALLVQKTTAQFSSLGKRKPWWVWSQPFIPVGVAVSILVGFFWWQARPKPVVVSPHPPVAARPTRPSVSHEDAPLAVGMTRFEGGTVFNPQGTVAFLKKDGARRRIFLQAGIVGVEVIKGRGQVEVETVAGRAIAWGTHFSVQVGGGGEMEKGKVKNVMRVVVMSGVVQLTNALGGVSLAAGEVGTATEGNAPMKQVEELAARFGQHYEPVKVSVNPKIPAYSLPLREQDIINIKDAEKLKVDVNRLLQQGFVVKPFGKVEHIDEPYETLREMNIPIFITADTVLHLYHIQFDQTLMDIEEREFIPDLEALSRALQKWALQGWDKEADPGLKESFRRLAGFFTVGLKLQQDKTNIPACVQMEVAQELQAIETHQGFANSPLFTYREDYSQYVPRGHYTKSEALKRYFKTMMWYGRMVFIAKGGEPWGSEGEPNLVSAKEGQIQSMAAALMTQVLSSLPVDHRKARGVWDRMYTVTAYYVGLADDLTVEDYLPCVNAALSGKTPAALQQPKTYLAFQWEVAKRRSPAIYGGTGEETDPLEGEPDPEVLKKTLEKTKGLRFMGQRFVPDSYMLGKLVSPTVGAPQGATPRQFTYVRSENGPIRGFPRGLDVLNVLGSDRAKAILADLGDDRYKNYAETVSALQGEFSKLSPADWNRNLYWSWLYSLQALLRTFGTGYPTFMTTEPYEAKNVTTALASWSQLRHDTILYAKQSYTGASTGPLPQRFPVEGYVEPLPEFYARLLALTRMTTKGLDVMGVLQEGARRRLSNFEVVLQRLLSLSEKELNHQELTKEDYLYIRNFVHAIRGSGMVEDGEGNIVRQVITESQKPSSRVADYGNYDPNKTILIADVHTDQNSGMALEEGTGYVELMVAAYRMPQGHIVIGAGPVLSYYEFKHPMGDRLTDEKWRERLKFRPPPQPEWLKVYRQPNP